MSKYLLGMKPKESKASTIDKDSSPTHNIVYVFLRCSTEMGNFFALVSHAHSIGQVLATVQPNL
jgi:hypothetical protein